MSSFTSLYARFDSYYYCVHSDVLNTLFVLLAVVLTCCIMLLFRLLIVVVIICIIIIWQRSFRSA